MTAAEAIPTLVPLNVPAEVNDRLLWAEGQRLAARHQPDAADPEHCGDLHCGEPYPCRGRRLADEAIRSSSADWHRIWTARLDLRSTRILASAGTSATLAFRAADRPRAVRRRGGGVP